MARSILNLGDDHEILRLRHHVLETAGFSVFTPADERQAHDAVESSRFDVAIACYSLPEHARKSIITEFRRANAEGCVVAVIRTQWDPECAEADECVQAIEGPEALIRAASTCKVATAK